MFPIGKTHENPPARRMLFRGGTVVDGMIRLLATTCVAAAFATPALAQTFPARQIRIVVPTAPGSGPDAVGRLIGAGLSKVLGQAVVTENKTGASGLLAFEYVAKQVPADGYTLALATPPFATIPAFFKDVRFDPQKDFAPVGVVMEAPLTLAVSAEAPFKTFRDMIAHARQNPGKLNMGTAGPQTAAALLSQGIMNKHEVKFANIAYSGGSPQTMLALLAREIDVAFYPEANVMAQGAKVRLIATTGERRLASAPDAPTFSELGFPEFPGTWYALLAPAGTPKPVVDRLNEAMRSALQLPEVKEGMAKMGQYPIGASPAATTKLIADQVKLFATMARSAGINPE